MSRNERNDLGMSDNWMAARNEFVRVVGIKVSRLTERQGYSRDRAISLVLQEIGGTSTLDEAELNQVKQRCVLAHQPACRVLRIATAFQNLVESQPPGSRMSHVNAVRQLTEKLEKATFTKKPFEIIKDDSATANTATQQIKVSEISLPVIKTAKTNVDTSAIKSSPSQTNFKTNVASPNIHKRTKSNVVSSIKSNKNKQRRRSIEEIGNSGGGELPEVATSNEPRPRADSVAEAVSAKLNQPQTITESKSSGGVAPTVRAKRTRSAATAFEAESTPNQAKRARSTE